MQMKVTTESFGVFVAKNDFTPERELKWEQNLATIIYNDEFTGLLAIYTVLGIKPNSVTRKMMINIDRERIKDDQSLEPAAQLERSRNNRLKKRQTEAQLNRNDPYKYGAGMAD